MASDTPPRTMAERLMHIETVVSEGIPQRTRMHDKLDRLDERLDRIEQTQLAMMNVHARVGILGLTTANQSKLLSDHDLTLRLHEKLKNRSAGVVWAVGIVASAATLLIPPFLSKVADKVFKGVIP